MKRTGLYVVNENGERLEDGRVVEWKQASKLLGKNAQQETRVANGVRQMCWTCRANSTVYTGK